MSDFEDLINKKDILEVKNNLLKLKTVLEQKIEDKTNELIQLQQELPHMIHLHRLSKMEKDK
jgi:hypothetical protein